MKRPIHTGPLIPVGIFVEGVEMTESESFHSSLKLIQILRPSFSVSREKYPIPELDTVVTNTSTEEVLREK